jgi:phosphoserine aminotransferase
MSSEIFSRPWDFSAQAITYACAQKNLGPAGATVLIISKDLLERANEKLPKILSYKANIAKYSRLNTPPVFPIHAMGLVFQWILDEGGVEVMARRNEEKAKILYDTIDESGGFYIGHSRKSCRSMMNVSFRTQSPELDARFLAAAKNNEMSALKGHRSVGGMRASIYNAFPRAGCVALAELMSVFARENG